MWENLLVALVVLGCSAFIVRKFVKQFRGKSGECGCGCNGCEPAGTEENCSGEEICKNGL